MVRGSSALSCESCGHLNDLRNVERAGLERAIRCEACAHVERWRIGSLESVWMAPPVPAEGPADA